MKAGVRAVGIAESYRGTDGRAPTDDGSPATSTLAAAVTRADRSVDGFAFGSCAVGGLDATDAIVDLIRSLDREDVRYLLVAGVALAWYNIVDLEAIHRAVDRPVLAVTFEASAGLEEAIDEAFERAERADRLARYRQLPARQPASVNGETVYVRSVGLEEQDPEAVLRAYTPAGGRPEPLRVARLAARAADEWRRAFNPDR